MLAKVDHRALFITIAEVFACLNFAVVSRFRSQRCTAGVSVLRSAMATKVTAETNFRSTDSATLRTSRSGWSCLESSVSTSSTIAGWLLA